MQPVVVVLNAADPAKIEYSEEKKKVTYDGKEAYFQCQAQLFGVTSGWSNNKPDKIASVGDVAGHTRHARDKAETVRLKGTTDASVSDEDFAVAQALEEAIKAQTALTVSGFARLSAAGDFPSKISGIKIHMAAVKDGLMVLRSESTHGAVWQLESAAVQDHQGAPIDDPLALLAGNPRGTLIFSIDTIPYGQKQLSVKPVLRLFRAASQEARLQPRAPTFIPAIVPTADEGDEPANKRAKTSMGGFGFGGKA